MKFKVGDRVRAIVPEWVPGWVGKVVGYRGNDLLVLFDPHPIGGTPFHNPLDYPESHFVLDQEYLNE